LVWFFIFKSTQINHTAVNKYDFHLLRLKKKEKTTAVILGFVSIDKAVEVELLHLGLMAINLDDALNDVDNPWGEIMQLPIKNN